MRLPIIVAFLLAGAGAARAQNMDAAAAMVAEDRAMREINRQHMAGERAMHIAMSEKFRYEQATRDLDREQWAAALAKFAEVAARKGSYAEGALYWQAYAAQRLGEQQKALAALDTLFQQYANSRWTEDAKALQMEIRQQSGKAADPAAQGSEELKLIALNGLIGQKPDTVLPVLEKLLRGTGAPRLKDRALFVLTQSNTPQARKILSEVARGKGNPDLQLKAVRYLGMTGTPDARQELKEIYRQSSDERVKSSILNGFMLARATDSLVEVARNEKDPQLRRTALQQLGVLRAGNELAQLFQSAGTVEEKLPILESLGMTGNSEQLFKLVSNESDPRLRMAAIRGLSHIYRKGTVGQFRGLYEKESDAKVKLELLNAMLVSGDAQTLIEVAKKDSDAAMRREAVTRLSQMRNKEAQAYLRELLEK